MSLFLLYTLCLGLPLLGVLVAFIFGPLTTMLQTLARRESNRLALVPITPRAIQPVPYDPLEASSWHKGIRAHIRYLARYVHVPPDLDEGGMPEELHCQLLVLAMLQNLFRTGRLQRPTVDATQSVSDIVSVTPRVRNQNR
ncbi:uncharacterized protein [Drosophila kikkawai]|uniref:Uncharacterized protein n=1 Tax=Drosophila kikkawai TaxID=30033 RepID=A0A6P4J6J8_DROKI|nr:uncharacterized protein LOC108080067 [Drosophila kikkawai]